MTAVAICLATVACSGAPDVHDLTQSARSWVATAQLTGDRWAHGATTQHFTLVALKRTSSELAQLTQSATKLRDTSALATRAHALLTSQLTIARGAVAALDAAASRGDRTHTAGAQAQLTRAGALLDSVSTATEQQ